MNALVQLFWICIAILESDYEHEFLLRLRLLDRVLTKLPLGHLQGEGGEDQSNLI